MTRENAGTHRIAVGDFTVTAIHDGLLVAGLGIVSGVPEDVAAGTLARNYAAVPPEITVSAFLIGHAGGLALVDTGSADKFGPGHGRLIANMTTLGVAPADITTILLTHAHIDHCGGMTGPDGLALYPNAEVVLARAELEHCMDAAPVPEARRAGKALAQACLGAYRDRLRPIEDGAEGLAGIRLLALPGHTPGHGGWMVGSGADRLLIWGDVVHMPGLQFARPDATVIYDLDPALAEASRRRALEMAATERLLVAGHHLDFPAFGHIQRRVEGYSFTAVAWRP